MRDLDILEKIQKETNLTFKRVDSIDYRDDIGQYVYDEDIDAIIGIKMARRASFIPTGIFELLNLEVLDLSLVKVAVLPDDIQRLTRLKKLKLYNTNVSKIPACIKYLTNLRNIHLGQTPLVSLPDELSSLTNLEKITLWGTKIRELPANINKLQKLSRLDLSDCRLRTLPESIVDLNIDFSVNEENYSAIRLVGTDIDDKEVMRHALQGKERLRKYFLSEEYRNKSHNIESKIVFLGNGAVGKTCLAHALMNNFFDSEQKKTDGIDIYDLKTEINGKAACIHMWDFGGQNVYHPLYTLFMSRSSLYIIVLNGRSDDRPDEWLQFIDTFCQGSPVIIVINRIDENPRADIDREYYLREYPNIKAIVRCSCKDADAGSGYIQELESEIIKTIQSDENLYTDWKDCWHTVKMELEQNGDSFITYNTFHNLCQENGVISISEEKSLFEKIVGTGIMLSYRESAYNLIRPKWFINAVSHVFSMIEETRGVFSLEKEKIYERLYEIDHSYQMDKAELVIQILANFHLCFPCGDNVFLPGALSAYQPHSIGEDYISWYKKIWRYEISPTVVMQRVLARLHRFIGDGTAWRNGILFSLEGNKVLVVQTRNELVVYVQKSEGSSIRDAVEYTDGCIAAVNIELHIPQNKVNEMISLRNGEKEFAYPLDNVKRLEQMNIAVFPVPELDAQFKTAELLGDYNVNQESHLSVIQLNEAYKNIIDRLDGMIASNVESRQTIEDLQEAIQALFHNSSEENKSKFKRTWEKCGSALSAIMAGSADVVTLLAYFGITLQTLVSAIK